MDELRGERVTLRPTVGADHEELRRIRRQPEVERWWDALQSGWPEAPSAGEGQFTILVSGRVAGFMQFEEVLDPDSRAVDVDIFLAAEHHGRGLGTEAFSLLVDWLTRERGHHRITLSTDPGNLGAIRCYEKVGFRAVGVTEASARWSDGVWRDEVLMELVRRPGG